LQIFRPRSNTIAVVLLVSLALLPFAVIAGAAVVARSEYVTGAGRVPVQPVPFSHAHHAGDLGIDCRYCHSGVETSAVAGIPPTATCMTCHSQIWTAAAMLAPVRDSYAQGGRLRWTRVNDLPDYVYFDHSVHVANGVACVTCHGAVGTMPLMRQEAPLTMEWCLDCHRDPGPNLSPPEVLFSPFKPDRAASERDIRALLAQYRVDAAGLTDCSVCHR
jgi:hypothetical protein